MNYNTVLYQVVKNKLEAEKEFSWLEKKLRLLSENFKDRSFYLAFSACPRFINKDTIIFNDSELNSLQTIYPNFEATTWSKDELARILLMTVLPIDRNQQVLDALFSTADYRELIALYKGLYFLENAATFVARIREGMRTNMVGVFDAVALNNPFPAKYLSEDGWNQLVLKTMFMGRPMYKIYQIEKRKNEKLALIFRDYAHERWAAHRKVTPELWRFVSGFVNDDFFEDIKKVILGNDELEKMAAAKALNESDFPQGKTWLANQSIAIDNLPSWNKIGKALEDEMTAVNNSIR